MRGPTSSKTFLYCHNIKLELLYPRRMPQGTGPASACDIRAVHFSCRIIVDTKSPLLAIVPFQLAVILRRGGSIEKLR
jgi:hypothetical protein